MKFVFALCTVVFGALAGALSGYALEFTPLVTHLFVDEVLCGGVAGFVSALVANQATQLAPEQRPYKWALSVALYGCVMGFLLAVVWYCFDFTGSLMMLGALSGVLSGIPAASAYGFLGGEPRCLGTAEAGNLIACLFLGGCIALFIGLDDGDFYTGAGLGAAVALFPALLGGRVNPWDHMD